MIEIISIIAQLIFFLVLFSFPFNTFNLNKILNLKNGTLKLIDVHVVNIIFFFISVYYPHFLTLI